ncbi:MAG: hypothetical protein ACREQN_13580 [Candidatus Binataceae bacterium]
MRWKKLGVVYKPDGNKWWARTHATVPTPLIVSPDVIRVYLTCRDEHGIGRVGFVELSASDPTQVLEVAPDPVLDVGRPGTFDDNGVMASTALRTVDGPVLLYYVGFELSTRVRYRLLTGLAISEDGQRFRRVQETPILERTPAELCIRGGPYVRYDEGMYRMWYVAGSEWIDLGCKQMPVYDLRTMESADGIHWPAEGEVILPVSADDEHGFGRPWVMRSGATWELFYSVRRKSLRAYRMGHAVSEDLKLWHRGDAEFGLEPSADGWDSEAVCYGAPLTINGRTWLFYNGNNFGETGFGIALRET